jgi:hypothetical protein
MLNTFRFIGQITMVMDFFASNGVGKHVYNFGPFHIDISKHWK